MEHLDVKWFPSRDQAEEHVARVLGAYDCARYEVGVELIDHAYHPGWWGVVVKAREKRTD
jgi:hypothetical protein